MPFQEGQSGNPNGRKKGSQNANTERLRSFVAQLLEDNLEQIKDDILKLKPRERVAAWTALLEYSLPKLQRSEMTFNIDKMSDSEIDQLLRRALDIAEQSTDNEDGQNEDSKEDSDGFGEF